jgi:hypothetical protein
LDPDLVRPVHRREHRPVDAAHAPAQAATIPECVRGVFGDHFQHRPIEVVGTGDRLGDIFGAQRGAPRGEALLESFLVHLFILRLAMPT